MLMSLRTSFLILIWGLLNTHSASANILSAESQKIIKEKRAVSDFTKIVVAGSGHLFIKQGEPEALIIETDSNFLPEVKSEITDKVLRLGPKDHLISIFQSKPLIKYYLTVKNVEEIHVEGQMTVSSNGTISAKAFNLLTEGEAKVDLKLKTNILNVRAAGNSDIALSGAATTQTLTIEGASKIQNKKLLTKNTQIEVSGAAAVEVNSAETLEVKMQGAGTVKYHGEPKITQEISGAGEIIPL